MTEYVLSVDIGTTSLKAGVISDTGEVVFVCKKSFFDKNSRFVAVKWLQALKSCIRAFENHLKKSIKISAISISGNGPTVVSCGGLTIRWNDNYKVDPARTGVSLFLPKLIAFKELYPKEYNRTQYLFSGPEYFVYELTGNAITLLPEQRFIPAYWNDDVLKSAEVSIPSQKLPPFVEPGKECGRLLKNTAEFLNLESGIPVYCGGPDFVAALIGTDTLQKGAICDRCGSSEGLNFCVNKWFLNESTRTLPSVISDLWNVSYLIPNSSRLKENERLQKVAEGIKILRTLAKENNLDFPDRIFVTGGQSKNKAYLQQKATALQMKVMVSNCNDAELVGDACVAFYGLGKFDSIKAAADSIVKTTVIYEPEIQD